MAVTLAVWNESTALADGDVAAMLPALTTQWNRDLQYHWRVKPCAPTFLAKGTAAPPGAWWCVFLDDSDQANALAYHDLTSEGLPIAKVFAKDILADNSEVSVGASHELCEMALDPWLNGAAQDSSGTFWAYEVCDPCQDDSYAYQIDNVWVSDFVTPDWFGPRVQDETFGAMLDFCKHLAQPFEVLPGGYAQYFDAGQGWQQVTGQEAATHGRKAVPLPGSRRERRARFYREQALRRSAPQHHR